MWQNLVFLREKNVKYASAEVYDKVKAKFVKHSFTVTRNSSIFSWTPRGRRRRGFPVNEVMQTLFILFPTIPVLKPVKGTKINHLCIRGFYGMELRGPTVVFPRQVSTSGCFTGPEVPM